VSLIAATPRLLVRELNVADLEMLRRMYDEPLLARHAELPASADDESGVIERELEHHHRQLGLGLWGVERRDDGVLIGLCGLVRSRIAGVEETEISYIIEREFRGQGFATEAGGAVLAHAFGSLRQPRVVAVVHPENGASIAVAKRIGMRHERDVRHEAHGIGALYVAHARVTDPSTQVRRRPASSASRPGGLD
jgi:[ribosomal protein S5]-alanine N-acetyltransferase